MPASTIATNESVLTSTRETKFQTKRAAHGTAPKVFLEPALAKSSALGAPPSCRLLVANVTKTEGFFAEWLVAAADPGILQ